MDSAASPFSFILFGASGHLARIKLYPALYILFMKDRLPDQFSIVGFARSEMTDESFREHVATAVKEDLKEVNNEKLGKFLEHVFYHRGNYDNEEDFRSLEKRLCELEGSWGSDVVRLAYLSIPPTVFTNVVHNLCRGGVRKEEISFRCIVEKPVGEDLESFEEVKKALTECFKEDETYLLDHFLGKEAIRNVYYLRLANPAIERLLKNTLIRHVEVVALEQGGIEGRAGYFDAAGTFRDMFQSHLLMMASLLTMRLRDEDESIAESRGDALKQLYLPPARGMNDLVIQGQYAPGENTKRKMRGYLEEDDVPDSSRTNTFAAMKLASRTSRWEGVPFYLKSGKRLERKETRVSIQFQSPRDMGEGSGPNRLDLILQGEAGMKFHLQTKMGGAEPKFRPLVLEDPLVCVGDCLPEHGILMLEAIHGVKQWFLSFEEVATAWRLIDPVQTHLSKSDTPLYAYPAGTRGPKEADAWIEKDGISWV